MKYHHYHITGIDKKGHQLIEIDVVEVGKKHQVVDAWGDKTGEADKMLAEYDDLQEAINYVIKIIKGKYPDCQIVYGAGAPPNVMIDEALRKIK